MSEGLTCEHNECDHKITGFEDFPGIGDRGLTVWKWNDGSVDIDSGGDSDTSVVLQPEEARRLARHLLEITEDSAPKEETVPEGLGPMEDLNVADMFKNGVIVTFATVFDLREAMDDQRGHGSS